MPMRKIECWLLLDTHVNNRGELTKVTAIGTRQSQPPDGRLSLKVVLEVDDEVLFPTATATVLAPQPRPVVSVGSTPKQRKQWEGDRTRLPETGKGTPR